MGASVSPLDNELLADVDARESSDRKHSVIFQRSLEATRTINKRHNKGFTTRRRRRRTRQFVVVVVEFANNGVVILVSPLYVVRVSVVEAGTVVGAVVGAAVAGQRSE